MSIYAIAAFVHNNQPIGARLLDTNTNRIKDCTNREIVDLLNTGSQFANLSIYRGKLTWNSGVYTRYAQVFADGHTENTNAATVLGIIPGSKKVKLVNYEGKQVILSMPDTIKYAKKYGISNCKVTHKDDTEFLQQISGNIPELESKLSMKMTDPTILDITLPEDGSVTELVIPPIVNGVDIGDLEIIRILPKTEAYRIKKISLPYNLPYIRTNVVRNLAYLEEVVINSSGSFIFESAFEGLTKLRTVHIKGCCMICNRAFSKCTSLETCIVYSGACEIKSEAFRYCTNLNIQKLLSSSVTALSGSRIFNKHPAEAVIIPENIGRVSHYAFLGMPNLHAMRVDGVTTHIDPDLNLDGDMYIKERNSIISTNIKLGKTEEDNYGFRYKNIKVHLVKVDDEDEKVKKTISKAKISGLSSANTLIYESRKDVSILLGTKTNKEIREFVLTCVNNGINSRNYIVKGNQKLGLYDIGYIFNSSKFHKCHIVGEKGDAIFYGDNKIYRIVPTSKSWLIKANSTDKRMGSYYGGDTFTIPYYIIPNNGKIDSIIYNDGKATVTFRNKTTIEIDALDFR